MPTILLDTAPETDWRNQADCRFEDPELFFPVGDSGPALLQAARAKAVCHGCPVMNECRAWALTTRQDAGVWGGLTEEERRAVLRRAARDRAAAQAQAGGER